MLVARPSAVSSPDRNIGTARTYALQWSNTQIDVVVAQDD